jgi:hypothetical protein
LMPCRNQGYCRTAARLPEGAKQNRSPHGNTQHPRIAATRSANVARPPPPPGTPGGWDPRRRRWAVAFPRKKVAGATMKAMARNGAVANMSGVCSTCQPPRLCPHIGHPNREPRGPFFGIGRRGFGSQPRRPSRPEEARRALFAQAPKSVPKEQTCWCGHPFMGGAMSDLVPSAGTPNRRQTISRPPETHPLFHCGITRSHGRHKRLRTRRQPIALAP